MPQLATSYQTLNGGKKFIFHLNPAAKFSDGTPVTSADVAWSLTRMVNLKGNPAFLLAGETITTDGPEAVVMTSSTPNPALPYILADPSCSILNMKVVEAHGGTDAANAATKDTAENWLNDNSAGSGPYVMKSFSLTSQVVLAANPNYWGRSRLTRPSSCAIPQRPPLSASTCSGGPMKSRSTSTPARLRA